MNNIEHFFFDGYELSENILSSIDNMKLITKIVNKKYFSDEGKIIIIPYFNGKIKEDGGVSGIVIGKNSHFTCHTFCYKSAMFVDYYGNKENYKNVLEDILSVYPTNDYDLCKNNTINGNFGKHIIVDLKIQYKYDEAINLINTILKEIDMTPINAIITNKVDDTNFDILQPIAESHISIHQYNDNTVIDVFSCKYFDHEKLLNILKTNEYIEINRGVKYK